MRLRKRVPSGVVLFAVVLGVPLAAGCGTVTAPPHGAKSAGTPAVTSPQTGTPRQRASTEAKTILSMFVPPPGAVRLAKQPALPSGSATMALDSAEQADAVAYWRVTGTATALRAWEKAHISPSFSRQDVIIGPPSWDTVYSLPPVSGVLPKREMNVQFYTVGGGVTVIMADAMVSWQPPRPASEVIPASVTSVTIAALQGGWQGNPPPVTVTSRTAVRQLAALVNALPLSTLPDDIPCPEEIGLTLTFRAAAGGPAVAVADGPAACGEVDLTLNGRAEPVLEPPDSYRAAVLKIAGVHWKLG